jgi:type II secretory pathway pseudopilin PulG
MWRSSRGDRVRRSRGPARDVARGFTLLEAMVSLLILVMVLIVAMTMLFQMRAFAERQQYFMLPRQAARRATDYLSYYVAGATDLNYVTATPNPNALITYYNLGGVLTQASYNNLTGTEPLNAVLPASGLRPANTSTRFGDIGTDVITMVAPVSPSRYLIFPNFPALGAGRDLYLNFRVGCATSDKDNEDAFEAATGFDGTQSALLMLVDNTGSWSYVRIPKTGYQSNGTNGTGTQSNATCADANFRNIHINVDTASGTLPEPPNGVAGLTDPVYLAAGLQVISFRVLTDSVDGIPKLQQKLGLFDPNTDFPGTDFTNVLENIEDLQVAYMYPDGGIWNTLSQTISSTSLAGVPPAPLVPGCPLAACDRGVPFQAGTNFGGPTPLLDVSNVIGLRFSVTGRSPLLPLAARQLTNIDVKEPLATTASQHFRPASEDHAAAMATATLPLYDQFDHYRATATLMLRNRIPRG